MSRSSRHDFHLNKAEGKFLGVCSGLADYLDVDALWVRVGLVTLTLLGFGATIPLYFATAFLASDKGRSLGYDDADEERRLRRRLAQGRSADARHNPLRSDLGEIDQRLSAMERHFGRGGQAPADTDRAH